MNEILKIKEFLNDNKILYYFVLKYYFLVLNQRKYDRKI